MRRPLYHLVLSATLLAVSGAPALAATRHHARELAASVRIVSSTSGDGESTIEIGPKLWSAHGVGLRDLISQVYGLDSSRLDLDSTSEDERFDVSLALRGDESDVVVRQALERALASQLDLRLSFETRTVTTYVMKTSGTPGSGLRTVSLRSQQSMEGVAPGEISVSGQRCPDLVYAEIKGHAATLAGLADALSDNLETPVVDETGLSGRYDFIIPEYHSEAELFGFLAHDLGISVTREERPVEVLIVRPASRTEYELRNGI